MLKRTKKVHGKTVKATLTKALKKGAATIKLTSKVGGKKLPPGTYKVKVTGKNTVGTSVAVVVEAQDPRLRGASTLAHPTSWPQDQEVRTQRRRLRLLPALLGAALVAGALAAVPAGAAPTWLAPPVTLAQGELGPADAQVVVDAAGNATAAWVMDGAHGHHPGGHASGRRHLVVAGHRRLRKLRQQPGPRRQRGGHRGRDLEPVRPTRPPWSTRPSRLRVARGRRPCRCPTGRSTRRTRRSSSTPRVTPSRSGWRTPDRPRSCGSPPGPRPARGRRPTTCRSPTTARPRTTTTWPSPPAGRPRPPGSSTTSRTVTWSSRPSGRPAAPSATPSGSPPPASRSRACRPSR